MASRLEGRAESSAPEVRQPHNVDPVPEGPRPSKGHSHRCARARDADPLLPVRVHHAPSLCLVADRQTIRSVLTTSRLELRRPRQPHRLTFEVGPLTLARAVQAAETEVRVPHTPVVGLANDVPRAALYAESVRRGDAAAVAPAASIVDGRAAGCQPDGPTPLPAPSSVLYPPAGLNDRPALSRTYMYWLLVRLVPLCVSSGQYCCEFKWFVAFPAFVERRKERWVDARWQLIDPWGCKRMV